MKPADLEQLRLSLLRYLDENPTRFGLNAAFLRQRAVSEGFSVDVPAVERELDYLTEKKLIEPVAKEVSPENRAWKITAAGRDYRAQREPNE